MRIIKIFPKQKQKHIFSRRFVCLSSSSLVIIKRHAIFYYKLWFDRHDFQPHFENTNWQHETDILFVPSVLYFVLQSIQHKSILYLVLQIMCFSWTGCQTPWCPEILVIVDLLFRCCKDSYLGTAIIAYTKYDCKEEGERGLQNIIWVFTIMRVISMNTSENNPSLILIWFDKRHVRV